MRGESLYWIIVLLTFIWIIFINKNNLIKIVIIMCFYAGLASFYGKTVENTYKIILVLFSIYLFLKNKGLSGLGRQERNILVIFIIFSISFLYSAVINGDYFNITFSQFSKYVTPVCLFLVINHILKKNQNIFTNYKGLFFSLITIQIILSFLKIPTIGLQETTVGSLSYIGGGVATILPVLGFILLWLEKQGDIKTKDWTYVILLMLIAFVSLKRAIWFIMPIFIFLFIYYVPRKIKSSHLLYVLFFIPLIFYAGVRLNPTLNKESKIGGSFDFNYVLEYAQNYTFGNKLKSPDTKLSAGRGGATFSLIRKLFNSQTLSSEDFWGTGLKGIYATDYEEFDEKKYGVDSKGSVTGVFQTYISSGYIGVFATVLLIISICNLIKEKRIRHSIALLIFWDYFFYIGLILRMQALLILLFFIILYSNLQYDKRLYQKYVIKKQNDKNRNIQPQPA